MLNQITPFDLAAVTVLLPDEEILFKYARYGGGNALNQGVIALQTKDPERTLELAKRLEEDLNEKADEGTETPKKPSDEKSKQSKSNELSIAIDPTFRIYPNVARSLARIEFELPYDLDEMGLAVFDFSGRKIVTVHQGALPAGIQQFELRRDQLGAAGTYAVRLQAGEAVLTRQIVFQ